MKMRTGYFKVAQMENALKFWEGFLQTNAHKKSKYWSEIKCDNINFGLLWMEAFETQKEQSNFIPVFELNEDQLLNAKERAISLGAEIAIDIADHPDKMSYVLADPFGNEFEITRFRN